MSGAESVLTAAVAERLKATHTLAELLGQPAPVYHAAPALDGHRLVTLRVAYADGFRGSDLKSVLGLLRLRAVTEPLT